MAVSNVEEVKEVAKIFPWERFHKVVDIGGSGTGFGKSFVTLQSTSRDARERHPANRVEQSNIPTSKP